MSDMRLLVDPSPQLPVFSEGLELVICVDVDAIPEIYLKLGVPKPDRHLVLGIMQSASMAVSESDPELMTFLEPVTVVLSRSDGSSKKLGAGLIVVRSEDGHLGVLSAVDPPQARRLAREALRWFTGTIRLDIP
ncbi:MAG: hypothetical protein HY914_18495 [Desulfomonile tiedjei]|nr:hypothetical protein [Desulfomonile tiedjei]